MSEKAFYNFDRVDKTGPLFGALERCRAVQQDPRYHPEGDVFTHSLQVFNKARRESTDADLLLAALLHDVGKVIDPYGHEKLGVQMLSGFISDKTTWLIENHMRFWYLVYGDMRKRQKVLSLRENEWFADLVMLCRWDKMGRVAGWQPKYDRVDFILFFKSLLEAR